MLTREKRTRNIRFKGEIFIIEGEIEGTNLPCTKEKGK